MKALKKQSKKIETIKKPWISPEFTIIAQANVNGGGFIAVLETIFTPKHTHLASNGSGPFPLSVFNNYYS